MKFLRSSRFLLPLILAGFLLAMQWGVNGIQAAELRAPAAPDAAEIVDDFQAGVPATWFTYGDWGNGAAYNTSTVVTNTLITPGTNANQVFRVAYNVSGWGVGGGRDLPPADWSDYDGLSLWFLGRNSGATIRIVLSDNKSGPGDTAERFANAIVDNFTGWQQFTFPWEAFYRDAWQPIGAPDDGLTLTEMWAYALIPASGSGVFYVDQVTLFKTTGAVVNDFQSGVPATWFTYGDWGNGAAYNTSTVVTNTLITPGTNANQVFRVAYNVGGWGVGGGSDLPPADWSDYDGLSLWFLGRNSGATIRIVLSDNKSGPGDTAERFANAIVDNFTGWRQFNFPWEAFYRDAWQPDGAPNDGLTLTEMWAYALIPASGSGVFYVDQVTLFKTTGAVVNDFQSGVPATWFTYGDWGKGAAYNTSTVVTNTLITPGTNANQVFRVAYNVGGWGVGGGRDLPPADWSDYDGLSLWFLGRNSGATIRIVLSDNKSGPGDTAERFANAIVDNFTGWRQFTFPWEAFYRDAWQPIGAPDDGLTLTEMWAYALIPASGSGVFYVDQITLFGAEDTVQVGFENAAYAVTEGDTATVTVTLNTAAPVTVTVAYTATDGTATSSDYTAASGLLSFAPGQTVKTFTVATTDDTKSEDAETVLLALGNPTNMELGSKNTAVLTIGDNDVANVCIQHVVPVDDFESGLPSGRDGDNLEIGFVTWGDFWTGTTVAITTTQVADSDPLALPGQSGPTHLLKLDVKVNGWGGMTHAFENAAVDTWISQDWSQYEGVSFWVYGRNAGTTLLFEVQDNRNPGSSTADAEIWNYTFTDNFTGWKYFEVPFSAFNRKEIGNGAPSDGFGRTEIHAWAFGTLGTGGPATYYLDDVSLMVRATGVDNFESGLPSGRDGDNLEIGFVTWGDFWTGTTVAITTTQVADSDPLALPCQSGPTHLLKLDVKVNGWGGMTHAFENPAVDTWITQDWSSYEGISFWVYGRNAGTTLLFEVQDNRNPGSSTADAEIWNYTFTDNFTGWKYFEVPFSAFNRKEIGNGAPSDGFGRAEIHAWAFGTLGTGGPATYYLDDVVIYGQTSVQTNLEVAFSAVEYDVDEGDLALITVKLNMISTEPVTVTYTTEQADAMNKALANQDFTPVTGTVVFAPGQTEKTFTVATLQDSKHEGSELLRLRLSDPHNADLGVAYQVRLYIEDDDPANPLLLGDFENGAYMFFSEGGVILGTDQITASSPMALPGQGAYEQVLKVEQPASGLRTGPAMFGTTFGQAQDWSGHDAFSFWYYGNNSGQNLKVELQDNRVADPGPSGWSLVWSDEFTGTAGTAPNEANWTHEIGNGFDQAINGWGNGEFEYYTNSTENAALDGAGNLVITAKEINPDTTNLECWYGKCEYTSARLISSQKVEVAYGRVEARLKLPFGQGLWPAFWMLGNNIGDVDWPASGEIDIMEHIGKDPDKAYGTIHGPGYSGGAGIGGSYMLPSGQFSDDFHTFAVEWEPGEIRWYVDGILYLTKTDADIPAGTTWVFDHPFYLLLNVAVGGTWPGSPDETTTFPQTMKVDYVRIYQAGDTAERFQASFTDNFSGWRQVILPFTNFARSAAQPVGAPNDGLTLSEVWGYVFTLPAQPGRTDYFDQFKLADLLKVYIPIIRE